MDGLNIGLIKRMPVVVPPIADQERFVRTIQSIDALRVLHNSHLAILDELFASLQHRAFTGQL